MFSRYLRRAGIWAAGLIVVSAIACSGDEQVVSKAPKSDDDADTQPNLPGDGGAGTGDDAPGDLPETPPSDDPGPENAPQGATNDCCVASDTEVSCVDATVSACVCAIDDYCCTTAWDDVCVGIATNDCGACGGPSDPPDDPGDPGDPPPDPGDGSDCFDCILMDCGLWCILDGTCCIEDAINACVNTCGQECLGFDPGDLGCGSSSSSGSSGSCGGNCSSGSSGSGSSSSGGGGDDCCLPHPSPGCADLSVEACVCGSDSYCCDVEWDDVCVDEVTQFGCGTC